MLKADFWISLTELKNIILNSQNQGTKTVTQMRRNQFEQQFQDSQANFSQAAPGQAQERSQGRPIQLLKVLPSGKIQLNQEALSLIASCESQVAFVSLVGKMRTGKSCLLNRLLGLAGKGFRVDPSVSSCTQGIWIWSQPIFNEANNCLTFFMDTEGSQSLQKDAQNDAKIFTLSLLISSYLVYNSVGCIDERSISDLEMVTALAHQIRTEEGMSERQTEEQLYRYMPKFIWLLRDVTLKIEDEYGRKITPTQYLQNCLTDQHSSQTSKKIKKSMLNYFKDRECLTMVRPVGDEAELQRLDSIPDHALRRQFIEVVGKLRDKLIKGSKPKSFGGQDVSGPAMVDMIEVFAESFNSGKIPSIRSAWQQISQDQGAKAYNYALNRYQHIFMQQFSNDEPKGEEQLHSILFKLRQTTMGEFQQNGGGKQQHQDFRRRLKELIDQKEMHIIEVNRNMCETRNNQILIKLSQEMKVKMGSRAYEENKQQMQQDFDNVVTRYNNEAKGSSKAQILAQFVKTMHKAFFAMDSSSSRNKNDDGIDKKKIAQLQAIIKMKQRQNDSLQRAAKIARQAADKAKAANRRPPPPPEQREKQGCCTGDKCLVM